MASVFSRSYPYQAYIPSFGTAWGFIIGALEDSPDVAGLSPQELGRRLESRLVTPLRYYDGITHSGLFALPKYLREALADESRLITVDSPVYAV